MYGIIDVGTTGVKTFIYDKNGMLIDSKKISLKFERQHNRYIEQDSKKLWDIIILSLKKLKHSGVRYFGVTTYRASVLVWDKDGNPYTNIITWIDRRGLEVFSNLPFYLKILAKLPYLKAIFSIDSPAILYRWILDKNPEYRDRIEKGELYFGTLDSYITYRLTGKYISDITNATLTGLIHPRTLKPISIATKLLRLPEYNPLITDNIDDFGEINGMEYVVSIADQQAASIAEGCIRNGCVKITNGTGSFVDMALDRFKMPREGLIPIRIVKIGNYEVFGVESFIPSSGIVLDWMLSKNIINNYNDICNDFEFNDIIYFLPMFRGLRIPYHLGASATIFGLTFNSSIKDIARGFIDGIAFLIQKILNEIKLDTGLKPDKVYCNGGLSKCNRLIQRISDYTGFDIVRPHSLEASSRGVLRLLRIARGELGIDDIKEPAESEVDIFKPLIPDKDRVDLIRKWEKALEVGLKWSI